MRILLSKEDMKTCDQNTIEGFGVSSCVLMERAALACVDELYHKQNLVRAEKGFHDLLQRIMSSTLPASSKDDLMGVWG